METLLQAEGLPDVVFSGVQGECEFVGRRWSVFDLVHLHHRGR